MLAFVLSGGGNRGALQVGALQVLLERGIQPDLMVGTFAGAMNVVFLASDPTPTGAHRLARFWGKVTREGIYPGGRLQVLWRLLCNRASLYSNKSFLRMLQAHLRASHLRRFEDLPAGIKTYLVAAELVSGREHVFGDDPDDLLLDALMASTALPPLHPPWLCKGAAYVDGAFTANLPVHVAAARGAVEIFALHVTQSEHARPMLRGVLDITFHAASAFLKHQLQDELRVEEAWTDVQLHYVPLTAYANVPFWDFRHAAAMVRAGRAAMDRFVDGQSHIHTGTKIPGPREQAGDAAAKPLDQVTVRTAH